MKQKTAEKIPLKVLYLEDSPHDIEIIREMLIDAKYNLHLDFTEKKNEFISFLHNNTYDVILSDFKLPGFDAFGALQLSNEICPEVPFICVSGSIGEDTAIELIKHGAVDYVLKDRMVKFPLAIQRALDEAKEKISRRQTEEALKESEESYRNLFDNHSAVKMLLDPDTGAILDANKAAAQYYGWTREELKHMTIQQINTLPPDVVNAEMSEVTLKGRVHFEFRHRRADGSIRDVEVFSITIEQKGKMVTSLDCS